MSLFLRLLLAYAAVGLLGGWALRRALRSLPDRVRARIAVAVAVTPYAVHAVDTAVRTAPRGGTGVALGYALVALVVAGLGAILAARWRRGVRLALVPLAYVGVALPVSWVLAAILRRSGETTDAIPLLVYLGASLVVAVVVAVERMRPPSGPSWLRRLGASSRTESGGGATGGRSGGVHPMRRLGSFVRALRRLAGRDGG